VSTGGSVSVSVKERARRRGIIIDLSTKTAKKLGFYKQGKTPVRLEVLKWGNKPKKR